MFLLLLAQMCKRRVLIFLLMWGSRVVGFGARILVQLQQKTLSLKGKRFICGSAAFVIPFAALWLFSVNPMKVDFSLFKPMNHENEM